MQANDVSRLKGRRTWLSLFALVLATGIDMRRVPSTSVAAFILGSSLSPRQTSRRVVQSQDCCDRKPSRTSLSGGHRSEDSISRRSDYSNSGEGGWAFDQLERRSKIQDAKQPCALDLRLTTFNLLAPCYKRMHTRKDPVHSETTGAALHAAEAKACEPARESDFADSWTERAIQTANFIRQEMLSSDIICLQEYWLHPAYENIFRLTLEDEYEFHILKRTGSKTDSVAILLRRGMFEARSSLRLSLSDIGDRVALIMQLRVHHNHSGAPRGLQANPNTGGDLVLVNTHLAFPHDDLDRENQMTQVRTLTTAVDWLVRMSDLPTVTPQLVVGDFNVEESDPVGRHMSSRGFRSAFTAVHEGERVVTHLNHRGEQLMVDHVFIKMPGLQDEPQDGVELTPCQVEDLVGYTEEGVSVKEASLLPEEIEPVAWNPRFELSDHRPLKVHLKLCTN